MTDAPAVQGYRPRPRWREVVAEWVDAAEGSAVFQCEVDPAGVSFEDLTWLLSGEITTAELWGYISPRIRNWNATAYDRATGEWVTAPDPATIGESAFKIVDPGVLGLCLECLTKSILGTVGDRPKGSKPPSDGDSGTPEATSVSTRRAKSPRSRKS